MCGASGRLTVATVVDHVTPHKGDQALFWDPVNWQSLCKRCHDSIKQKQEHGKAVGFDASGVPLDPSHHWT